MLDIFAISVIFTPFFAGVWFWRRRGWPLNANGRKEHDLNDVCKLWKCWSRWSPRTLHEVQLWFLVGQSRVPIRHPGGHRPANLCSYEQHYFKSIPRRWCSPKKRGHHCQVPTLESGINVASVKKEPWKPKISKTNKRSRPTLIRT